MNGVLVGQVALDGDMTSVDEQVRGSRRGDTAYGISNVASVARDIDLPLGNDDDGEELMGSLTVSVPALYIVPAASRTISSSTPFSKAMEVKEGISAVYIDVKQP